MKRPPSLITLDPDDYSAHDVGHTAEGLQFFLTTPFVPAVKGAPAREFIALFIFRADGALAEARIDDLTTHSTVDPALAAPLLIAEHFLSLGPTTRRRIQMQPFQVERFGVTFGLVPRPPEDEDEGWWVELKPGNYMAFHEPWDSGEYET
jgi:hypothetical protein